MKPLVKITENIVEKSVSRLGAIQTHIFLNWKNIAGQYADVTFPDKIKFDKKKNSEGLIDLGYVHVNNDHNVMIENTLIDKNNLISSNLPDGELKLAMQEFEISRKLKK